MLKLTRLASVLVVLACGVAGIQAQELPWQPDLEKALEKAAAEKKPVLVCMHWQEETACITMLKTTYRNPDVRRRMASDFILVGTCPDGHEEVEAEVDGRKKMVSALFGTVSCDELVRCERQMRSGILEAKKVIVPSHHFLYPDGRVILSKDYIVDSGKLIAMMKQAALIFADATIDGLELRLKEPLLLVKKGRSEERRDNVRVVLNTNEQRAIELLFTVIDNLKAPRDRIEAIRAMGYPSHEEAAPILLRWLDDEREDIRNAAVVSLEEIAAAEAGPRLLELWESARDPELKKDILRALGPCAAGNERARAILLDEVTSSKEEIRRACYLSLGYFASAQGPGLEITEALKAGWKKEGRSFVQLATLLVAFQRSGDDGLVPTIRELLDGNKNHQLVELADSVCAALEDGTTGIGADSSVMKDICASDRYVRNALR